MALTLLALPSAAWSKASASPDGGKRPACFRTIPADGARAARTVKVPCTWRSIPPLLNPTPFFLP